MEFDIRFYDKNQQSTLYILHYCVIVEPSDLTSWGLKLITNLFQNKHNRFMQTALNNFHVKINFLPSV